MANISQFYKNLRDLCEERSITINELVKILDLSTGSPTAWKNGTVPRSKTLSKLADYFGVSTDFLIGAGSSEISLLTKIKENSPGEIVLTEREFRIMTAIREMSPERQKALADLLGISDDQQ